MGELSKRAADIKFFIHDLRVDRFFLHLLTIHEIFRDTYDESGLDEERDRHVNYITRLTRRRAAASEARTTYEMTVKSGGADQEIIDSGRAYIRATLEACRVCLLPHWRNFESFLGRLPNDTPCRKFESEFHETKNWVTAIHHRIQNFLHYADEEAPNEVLDVAELVKNYVDTTLRSYVRSASSNTVFIRLGKLEPGRIFAQRMGFRRVLFNLLMNAVDAMRDRPKDIIRIDVRSDELIVTVSVADKGAGMSPEKIEQILYSEASLRGELHSLGFRFVRQTVQTYNGKIYVDSTVGAGTTVRLQFPRHISEHEEQDRPPTGSLAALAPPEEEDDTARAGALIVDDFCRSLAPLPGCLFSIGIADNGDVDHFAHKPYDPDWMMGHEDLAPMLYRAVFRGRYETDDQCGTALILKAPHGFEDYWEIRDTPDEVRSEEAGRRMIHNEYVRIGRHLIATGMDMQTRVYITNTDQFFEPFEQAFDREPFALAEMANKETV